MALATESSRPGGRQGAEKEEKEKIILWASVSLCGYSFSISLGPDSALLGGRGP